MITLSVIIPSYNSSETIERCLSSLIIQNFKDFEVCIIDGASSDDTLVKARSFASRLKALKIVSEPDEGIYHAMNKGISISQGEWIYFLGSDDEIYNENVFETIFIPELISSYTVIYGNIVSPRFNGLYDGEFDADKLYQKNICHQAIFFNKTVFKAIGKFNIKNRVYADWEHNMRWFYKSSIKKIFVDVIIAKYADGGFSSLNEDLYFSKQKRVIALSRGFLSISYLLRCDIIQELKLEFISTLKYCIKAVLSFNLKLK
jgi:glycosyltransferase involved in cell wall biosynthesis